MKSILASVFGFRAFARAGSVFARFWAGFAPERMEWGGVAFFVFLVLGLASNGFATYTSINTGTANFSTITQDTLYVYGSNNVTITGYASGKVLILGANRGNGITHANATITTTTVTFRGLTLTGTTTYAAAVYTNKNTAATGNSARAGATVTINLEETNTLTGGIGGAGLRVPLTSTLTINGPGTLTANGGMWRSLVGLDAGAGIGGGSVENASDQVTTTQGRNGNYRDTCGTVTINGGTIFAYGGGGGESSSGNTGARCSYAPGIGGSGYNGRGCILTINGGNVTAAGGLSSLNNGIGAGIYSTANVTGQTFNYCNNANNSYTHLTNSDGSTTINGGSVNATVRNYGATANTTVNGRGNNGGAVTQKTVIIGRSNTAESGGKSVESCTFGTGTSAVNCTKNTSITSGYQYGINDVKTNSNGEVYFWLNTDGSTGNTVALDINGKNKTYTRLQGTTNLTFEGDAPTMDVPLAPANAFVGGSENEYLECADAGNCPQATSTGPYKTHFRMDALNHFAAVGHTITAYKGNYVRNDASTEAIGTTANTAGNNSRVHLVRWIRADDWNFAQNRPSGDTTHLTSNFTNSFFSGYSTNGVPGTCGTGTNARKCNEVTYTPTADDYGKYIYAQVLVRDVGTKPASANVAETYWNTNSVIYPPIKVGIVVQNTQPICHESLPESLCSNSLASSSFQQFGSTPTQNLVTNFNTQLEVFASVPILGGSVEYTWNAYLKNRANTIKNIATGQFTATSNNPIGNIGSRVIFSIPTDEPSKPTGNYDTLFLSVVVKDGDRPNVTDIEVYCATGTGGVIDLSNCPSNDKVGSTNLSMNGQIHKSGRIKLTFNNNVFNLSEPAENDEGERIGSVYISDNVTGEITSLQCIYNNSNNTGENADKELICPYGTTTPLVGGRAYTLVVKDFVNYVPQPMLYQFQTTLNVERKASTTEILYSSNYFLVGSIYTGSFTYVPGQGGDATGYKYCWQDGGNSADPTGTDGTFASICGTSPSSSSGPFSNASASSGALDYSKFGYWVRLVVQPIGTNPIDGGTEGEVTYGAWKRIGVMLSPGTVDEVPCKGGGNCPVATNISFQGCDPSTFKDGEMPHCYGKTSGFSGGFVVYDNTSVRLSAIYKNIDKDDNTTDYYQITGWEDDFDTKNICSSNPTAVIRNCSRQFADYFIAIPPTKGTIAITPQVKIISPPEVKSAELGLVGGGTVNLIDADGSGNIAILNNDNAVEITFEPGVAKGTGSVKLYKGSSPVNGAVNNDCEGTTCSLGIPSDLEFNTIYKLVISDFTNDVGDKMDTKTLSFTTASGPTVTAVLDVNNVYAIGKTITGDTTGYEANGGSTAGNPYYCWQLESKINTPSYSCENTSSSKTYLIQNTAFKDKIRLRVTPIDDDDREGIYDYTDWQRIGVLLTMGTLTPQQAKGTTQTVYLGSSGKVEYTCSNGSCSSSSTENEVAYGPTAKVSWNSNTGTDKIVKWSAVSNVGSFAVGEDTKSIATYTLPDNPTGDIKLDLKIDNGEPLLITSAKYDKGTDEEEPAIVLVFSNNVSTANATFTIRSGANTVATLTLSDIEDYYDDDTKTLTLPLSEFADYSVPSNGQHIVGINSSAFCDESDNCTQENNTLLVISNIEYVQLNVNPRTITLNDEYGDLGDDGDGFATPKIVISNTGSKGGPDLKATLTVCKEGDTPNSCVEGDYGFEYSSTSTGISSPSGSSNVINIPALSASSGEASFYIKSGKELGAGTYVGKVSIECQVSTSDDCPATGQLDISLTFTVRKKTLARPSPTLAFSSIDGLDPGTKIYDGYAELNASLLENGSAWSWTRTEAASFDNAVASVNVVANKGSFGDALAGKNKPIGIEFEITGSKKANYAFGADGSLTTPHPGGTLRGAILQKPLTIEFRPGHLGQRHFNGASDFEVAVNPNLYEMRGIVKIGDDEDDVKVGSETVFYFENSNALDDKHIVRANIVLDGVDAGNYAVGQVSGLNGGVLGSIKPISIADYLPLGDSPCQEDDCELIAELTYGDILATAYPVETEATEVKIDGMSLGGMWRMCVVGDGNIPAEACGKGSLLKPRNHIVSPIDDEQEVYYAYFHARSNNYEKDFAVPVTFDIAPKPITISVDLSESGNKIYDGDAEIELGNVKASNGTPGLVTNHNNVKDILGEDAEATFAYFDDENAGTNKLLTVKWELKGDAAKKYRANETVTLGTIAKRNVNLLGIEVGQKYYDGTFEADNVDYSDISLETQAKAKDKNTGIIAADVSKVEVSASEGLKFEFINPNVGKDKQIVPAENGEFKLDGTKSGNYALVLASLKGDILPASLADILCEPMGIKCPANTDAAKAKWIADNEDKIVEKFMGDKNAELNGIYGQTLAEIQNQIQTVMPNTIGELFSIKGGDSRPVTWTWADAAERAKTVAAVYEDKTVGNAFFVHGDPNYETGITVPIPITSKARQLTATLVPENKNYDTNTTIRIRVVPGNVLSGDDVSLKLIGYVDDPNAGNNKDIVGIFPLGIEWEDKTPQSIKYNYILPNLEDETQVKQKWQDLKVSIGKIQWPEDIKPEPTEYSLLYDETRNLASVGLTVSGWSWAKGDSLFTNPNDRSSPLYNEENDGHYERHRAVFAPPPDEPNYMDAEHYIDLFISKRSEDNSVASIGINTECGADTAKITVNTNDMFAEVWFNNTNYGTNGTFLASALKYGYNNIPYEVQAQAYGPNFLADHSVDYIRYLPFAKVAGWIRDKTLTITLDSSQTSEQELFRAYKFDLAKTEWYSGKSVVATGRNMAANSGSGSDYWVRLYTTDGDIFQSCKISGAAPELTPLMPPKAGSIKLIASAFGSRVVAGGTTLTLNTPYGGIVTVYTMKGEQVSKTQAVDNRTIVKIPNAKGMYIVKLEAK